MIVLAVPGILVPKEGAPRTYISDVPPDGEAGFSVEPSAYYLRRIADGDLVEVVPSDSAPAASTPPSAADGDLVQPTPTKASKKKEA